MSEAIAGDSGLAARLLESGHAAKQSPPKLNFHAITGSKRRQVFDEMLKKRNVLISGLVVVQLTIMVIMLEFGYRTACEDPLSGQMDERDGSAPCHLPDVLVASYDRSLVDPICAAMGGTSCVALVLLYNYYVLKWQVYCKLTLQPKDPISAAAFTRPPPLWSGHMAGPFALEVVVMVLQPLPGMPRGP